MPPRSFSSKALEGFKLTFFILFPIGMSWHLTEPQRLKERTEQFHADYERRQPKFHEMMSLKEKMAREAAAAQEEEEKEVPKQVQAYDNQLRELAKQAKAQKEAAEAAMKAEEERSKRGWLGWIGWGRGQ